jgi:hypothetical protein
VLPPSNEPGLWSADSPRAATEYAVPDVFGFTPPNVTPEEAIAAVYADSCAQRVDDTARFPSVAKALARLSKHEAACTGARAFYSCLMGPWLEASGKNDIQSRAVARALSLYNKRALRGMDDACKGLDLQRQDLLALLRTVETAWMNSTKRR